MLKPRYMKQCVNGASVSFLIPKIYWNCLCINEAFWWELWFYYFWWELCLFLLFHR